MPLRAGQVIPQSGGCLQGLECIDTWQHPHVDELKKIPERFKGQNIDLMLIHLGGTTIPSPSVPLLMVTMDAKQSHELVRLINPDLTIPIYYEYVAVIQSPDRDPQCSFLPTMTTMSSYLPCRISKWRWKMQAQAAKSCTWIGRISTSSK
jgi:hypothetical protein